MTMKPPDDFSGGSISRVAPSVILSEAKDLIALATGMRSFAALRTTATICFNVEDDETNFRQRRGLRFQGLST
jgi:hypothetical protein